MTFLQNYKTKIFIFEYFPKNNFRNELHAPFLPCVDTQHLTWNLNFVCRGSQLGVVRRFFQFKQCLSPYVNTQNYIYVIL